MTVRFKVTLIVRLMLLICFSIKAQGISEFGENVDFYISPNPIFTAESLYMGAPFFVIQLKDLLYLSLPESQVFKDVCPLFCLIVLKFLL